MEKFANKHAPTLFTQLLNSITNRNSVQTKERHELQRKRTVVQVNIYTSKFLMARINKYTFLLLLLSFQETVIIFFLNHLPQSNHLPKVFITK